jgi:probable HAF family extracellular repeat protein
MAYRSHPLRVLTLTALAGLAACQSESPTGTAPPPAESRAAPITVTDLGVLPGGSTSFAFDVSPQGVIVGASDVAGNGLFFHGVRWVNGVMQDLGTFNGQSTQMGRIFDNGVIAGHTQVGSLFFPFIWQQGSGYTALPGDGWAYGIGKGIVVGCSQALQLNIYVRSGSSYTLTHPTLPPSWNATSACAYDANDRGDYTGYYLTAGGYRPFAYWKGSFYSLPLPATGTTGANGFSINHAGAVIGSSSGDPNLYTALYWATPQSQPIELGTTASTPVFYRSFGLGINNKGWLTGTMCCGAVIGTGPAFLWRPNRGLLALGAISGPTGIGSAYGVNDAGLIVGESQHPTDSLHATLWRITQ